jgi:hypothetical protein
MGNGIYGIDLYIFPHVGAHCGYGIQQGVLKPSLPWIPGRVVRGALAGWAVRNGIIDPSSEEFEELFLPSEAKSSVISFPWCTFLGRLPAPFSAFEQKGGGGHPAAMLIGEEKLVAIEEYNEKSIKGTGPVDFLLPDIWPAEHEDKTLKPCRGTVDLYGAYFPPCRTILEMKSAHEPEKGRVGKNGLRIEEVMPSISRKDPAAIYYTGRLYCTREKDFQRFAKLLLPPEMPGIASLKPEQILDPEPEHRLFVGRKKVPAAVFGRIANEQLCREVIDREDGLTITLISDLLPDDIAGEKQALWEQLLASLALQAEEKNKKAFCMPALVHGYEGGDRGEGKAVCRTGLTAGSCIRVTGKFDKEKRENLRKTGCMGAGLQARDGFGRFIVDWSVHGETMGEGGKNI